MQFHGKSLRNSCESQVQRAVVQQMTSTSEKGGSQVQRAVVQHCDRQVTQGKKAGCFTLLRRITSYKMCQFGGQVERREYYRSTTWKGIPRRAHAILSNRHEYDRNSNSNC